MPSSAPRLLSYILISLVTLIALQSKAAESEHDNPSLATLTQSAIELQKDLLASREKLLPQSEQLGLTIYLDARNISDDSRLEIEIEIDNQAIIKRSIDAQHGIQKIYSGALVVGEHQIKAHLHNDRKTISKDLGLDKTNGQDIIKITLGRGNNPSLSFHHQQRAIGQ